MRHADLRITLLALGFAALPAGADTLVMRDGKQVEGTLLGATARQVDFLPGSGKAIKVPLDTIQTIQVSAPVVRPTTATQQECKVGTIPTGSLLRARTL